MSVWAESDTSVFAGGGSGTILPYDGVAWTKMESGVSGGIRGVWGRTSSDVYAAAARPDGGGLVLRFDGQKWSVETSSSSRLHDIWGDQSDDVFVVGEHEVLHFDGAALTSVWGSSFNNVLVTSFGGNILHFDGVSWD
jgi:hypothetical protein